MGIRPERPLQLIAGDDIGVFVAKAFDNPRDYWKREIELAGDELTGTQIAEHFARAIGRSVDFVQTPIEQIRRFSKDYALMIEWFNANRFEADLVRLREEHPGLESLDTWLVRAAWKKVEPIHA
jgi:uncharacterized protein YbjT (DUF2867 family)